MALAQQELRPPYKFANRHCRATFIAALAGMQYLMLQELRPARELATGSTARRFFALCPAFWRVSRF